MAKVTSKLQVTIPKAIAKQYAITPGDDLLWVAAGEAVHLLPAKRLPKPMDTASRLSLFDAATKRVVAHRRKQTPLHREGNDTRSKTDRGWTREDLYQRGRSR
jgi:AbrB family looped-hinge helix DNA binding protein